jgi:basic membrane lipoprotein Med (substrate-binding protein (PBP1-ABC) superfamily)
MTEAIPEEVRASATALMESIASGEYHPFTGPINMQDGTAWLAEGESPKTAARRHGLLRRRHDGRIPN